MKPLSLACAICILGFGMNAVRALEIGDKAPSFEGIDDQGQPWKSSDHVGKGLLVVYFYPADLTGGCTKQACGFRDDMQVLKEKGVEVVGVSGDSVKNHEIFKKTKNLNFTLLADEKGKIAKAFGVPTRKGGVAKVTSSDGPISLTRGVTASRWTFIIDKDGKVVFKETKVNAAEDSKTVLKHLKSLK